MYNYTDFILYLLSYYISGNFQLHHLTNDIIKGLLHDVVTVNFGLQEPVNLTFSSDNLRYADWLRRVWTNILERRLDLRSLENIPLMPRLISGEWDTEDAEVHLLKLCHKFLLNVADERSEIAQGVCRAFGYLNVITLPSLPDWIDAGKIRNIFYPTQASILQLLNSLEYVSNDIARFNDQCEISDRESLISMVASGGTKLPRNAISLLQQLRLFPQMRSFQDTDGPYVTVKENGRIATEIEDFPIHFPTPLLVLSSHDCLNLAKSIGASVVSEVQLVYNVLHAITEDFYSENEMKLFMEWFLHNISRYIKCSQINSLAASVSFVSNGVERHKPSDLYDPRDEFLQSLFAGENMFPTGDFCSDNSLNALQLLGLKRKTSVNTGDCIRTAKMIDTLSESSADEHQILKKANALFQLLENHANDSSNDKRKTALDFFSEIGQVKCIPHVKTRPSSYPCILQWKGSESVVCRAFELKSIKHANTVGSVRPLVSFTSETLGMVFRWNSEPNIEDIAKQLEVIVSSYSSEHKPEILPLVSDIYKAFDKLFVQASASFAFKNMINAKSVWWGDGFCRPENVVIEKIADDIDLHPFIHFLPAECQQVKKFFRLIGCSESQDIDVLLRAQNMIQRKYLNQSSNDKHECRKDLNLILQILHKLYQLKDSLHDNEHSILFPVQSEGEDKLVLELQPKCIYCDSEWLRTLTENDGHGKDDDNEELMYIHEEVPAYIADGLGVKSLRQLMMSDSEGLEEWGQEEPLTRRLNKLLAEGYLDGLSVPKEIIQNADDAGATEVRFLFDERENMDARTHLLDEGMAQLQGPALWAYNNAIFSKEDLVNITKLSGATKETDTTKIGKFGLGFCAVYNLTDVPSFITGKDVVIFDPHTKYLGKALPGSSPGIRINLEIKGNVMMVRRMKNQFKPFQDIFGCDLSLKNGDMSFPGTLFRLPLRTPQQAAASEIKRESYSRQEVLHLLKLFIQASGNMLLFTQHVQEISLYHIPASDVPPSDAVRLCLIQKHVHQADVNVSVLELCSQLKRSKVLQSNPLDILQKVTISLDCQNADSLLQDLPAKNSTCTWFINWSSGTSESLKLSYSTTIKGALPVAGVAMLVDIENNVLTPKNVCCAPFGFYDKGHMFCYLPLPRQSHLNVHVNGSFAVTSDRRGLRTNTEDEKYSYDTIWNEALIGDAVVRAFTCLLSRLHDEGCSFQHSLSREYKFYQFWPVEDKKEVDCFRRSFYGRLILSDTPMFESHGVWIGLSQCLFLERSLAYNTDVGTSARITLHKFRVDQRCFVVDLPAVYFDQLLRNDKLKDRCHLVTATEFFSDFFLPNIDNTYWDESEAKRKERNELILYCLDHSNAEIDKVLKFTKCIPSSRRGCLMTPGNLIHPESDFACLFDADEGRFPDKAFMGYKALRKLEMLGMMRQEMEPKLILDRAKTVNHLAFTNNYSAAEGRSKGLVAYISSCRSIPQCIVQELQNVAFLPVLKKPTTWPFKWEGERDNSTQDSTMTSYFAEPGKLFLDECKYIIACKKLIVNIAAFHDVKTHLETLQLLGVNCVEDVCLDVVLEQLLTVAGETDKQHSTEQKRILGSICCKIYQYLNKEILLKSQAKETIIRTLKGKSVVWLENGFFSASKVAYFVGHDCSPELFEIGTNAIGRYQDVLMALGVKQTFQPEDIIRILQAKKSYFRDTSLPKSDFLLIRNLIQCLSDIMVKEGLSFDDISRLGDENIVAPDALMILRPTYQLCFDECEDDDEDATVFCVHKEISRIVAENVGVRTRDRKSLEDSTLDMIPFEQKEELVTRLKGLLNGYPLDIGIMKELIQNADDAGASEIHFVKDFRHLKCENIFDPSFADFQGPSLCVYNDSSFSQMDLVGIQKLGTGSKTEDPAKTGQYGVGFNVVYNLTDLPSFLTKGPDLEGGETLCLFDPLHKHSKRKVGWRYKNMKSIRKRYPDVLSGYNEEVLFNGKTNGTVFRFPLRKSASEISGHVPSWESLSKLFDGFKMEALETLLFLKSITKITVSNIMHENLVEEWSQSVTLNEDDKRMRCVFSKYCKYFAGRFIEDRNTLFSTFPLQVCYELHSDDIRKNESWFVVQRLGFYNSKRAEDVVVAVKDGRLGLLPVGGVALHMPRRNKSANVLNTKDDPDKLGLNVSLLRRGKVFCFLPLPQSTDLPVHINGHFVLHHETRRSLWIGDEGFKPKWNRMILEHTVAPAYIEALKFLKKTMFPPSSTNSHLKHKIEESVRAFEWFFPLAKDAKDEDWYSLVVEVFKLIVDTKELLFPVISMFTETDVVQTCTTKYTCSWHALYEHGHKFQLYFVGTESCLEGHGELLDLLKAVGMKICSFSRNTQASLTQVGCVCPILKPDAVIKYLKSGDCSEAGSFRIGRMPTSVRSSVFKTASSVESLLSYCNTNENLEKELNGLPLLITNDGALRYFDSDCPVYCTEYYCLLEQSSDKFVHPHFIEQLRKICKCGNSGVIKVMKVCDFADMLPDEVDCSEELQQTSYSWIANGSAIPNGEWILKLWSFIREDFQCQQNRNSAWKLDSHLEPLKHWCLIPALKGNEEEILMKISDIKYVMDLKSFASRGHLEGAFRKLGLPHLDDKHIPLEISELLSSLLVKADNPLSVLQYLLHYRQDIGWQKLKRTECSAVLHYFSQNLDALGQARNNDCALQNELRSLPFFCTRTGKHMSLGSHTDWVLVLPPLIPTLGLEEWASKTHTILLCENNYLDKLYQFLGFSSTDETDIYLHHITRKWQYLPFSAIPVHLKYIKDRVLLSGTIGLSQKQTDLVRVLKNLPVIPHKGDCKKASEFYSPYHPVFIAMLNADEFPPEPFCNDEWRYFLEQIGLRKEVTSEMFVQFARKIAKSCDGLKKRAETSAILLDHLLGYSHDWDESVYKEISQIPFVLSHTINEKYAKIHEQYSPIDSFVSFSGSVSCRHERMSWTCMNILPIVADPHHYRSNKIKDKMESWLGVHHEPPMEMVVHHCKNVCSSLKRAIQDDSKRQEVYNWLEDFLDELYSCVQKQNISNERLRTELYETPLVFIHKANTLVPAYQIIEELADTQEIPPYIFRAPIRYGKYFQFLRILDTATKPSFLHYVKVLSCLKHETGDRQLDKEFLGDLGVVRACLSNLFNCLDPQLNKDAPNIAPHGTVLYLPSICQQLVEVSKLVVVDNNSMEQRLRGAANLQYFIGFKKLNLRYTLDSIHWLPESIRPRLLSDIVKEEIVTSGMVVQQSSCTAVRLENFIKSIFFEEGLLRLIKHFKAKNGGDFSHTDEEMVITYLRNTTVNQVTGLKTVLIIGGRRVPGSEKDENCFVSHTKISSSQQDEITRVYFQKGNVSELEWLQGIDIYLIDYISHIQCACIPDKYVLKLFQKMGEPHSIPIMLDELKIAAYDLPAEFESSVFPEPGTYVPEELHHLLNCEFAHIYPHEYNSVAMEVEDVGLLDGETAQEDYSPVYIYVRIERELPTDETCSEMNRKYEVFTGTATLIVSALRLYKFLRPSKENTQRKLVATSTTPNQEPGQQSAKTEHLHSGGASSSTTSTSASNSQTYQTLEEAFASVREALLEAWKLPEDDRSHRSYADEFHTTFASGGRRRDNQRFDFGSFTHRESSQRAYHDYGEANRWQRQAKLDLTAAIHCLETTEEPPVYNWICYMCHQVRNVLLLVNVLNEFHAPYMFRIQLQWY